MGSILSVFSKNRIIRTDPLSIMDPLPRPRFNTLDIRPDEVVPSVRTYPDIYTLPVPISRRAKKTLRKHRKRIVV